jgi:dihydroxyacetone kinase-like predicted kinase
MNTTENRVCFVTADTMRLIIANCSATIENNTSKLNDLNFFPVPDGDTGSNMALTLSAAAREIRSNTSESAG